MKKLHNPKDKRKRIFSIKLKVILLVISCIITTLISCIGIILPNVKHTLKSTIKDSMIDLTIAYSKGVDHSIENINSSLYQINTNNAFYYYTLSQDPSNTMGVRDLIKEYTLKYTNIRALYAIDLKGKVFVSSEEEAVGTDFSKESFFQSIIKTRKAAQSNVCNVGLGKEYILCGVPLYSHTEELIGVLAVSLPVEKLQNNVSEVELSGAEHTVVYLLDSKGIVICHNSAAEKIGHKIDNPAMLNVVNKMTSKNTPLPKVIEYRENNTIHYGSYYTSPSNHWTMVISVEENDVLAPVREIQNLVLFTFVFLLLLLSAVGYIFASSITKPIRKITRIVRKTSEFDFTEDPELSRMCNSKDETGHMSRAISNMRNQLKVILEDIHVVSSNMNKNALDLNEVSNHVNEYATESSATTEELSAGMEETAATTEDINTRIEDIQKQTVQINHKLKDGSSLAKEIMERSSQLRSSTLSASDYTQSMYYEVKKQTKEALEHSKAVEKINVFTNSILEITEQTRLLSLNASIEAARAGDAGRGFAVVAHEIGKLAQQSSATVVNIEEIVSEVHLAFKNVSTCLDKTLLFLEKTILADYKSFLQVSDQYHEDADSFHHYMNQISTSMELFQSHINDIGASISAINLTISEAALGTGEITERNTDIVKLTEKTYELATESTEHSEQLYKITERFQL
jgi:Methyl-accepting chemotaxis protein